MMVSDEMGDIPAGNSKGLGLYFSDTRFVSTYEFRLNRLQPILLSASVDESYVATFQMVNPVLLLDEGKRRIPQQSLSIRRSRFIYGGLHERIGIQNCGTEPVEIECSLRIEGDFRDMFDVRGYKVQTLGTIRPTEVNTRGLTFTYDGQDGLLRRTEVVVKPEPRTLNQDGTLNWHFHLNSKDTVTLVIDVIPVIGENEPMLSYLYDDALQALQGSYRRWHDNTTRISTDNAFLDRGLLRRSQMDLRILLEEFDSGLFPMAGIPWFSAPFGRDALIASIQTLMLNPEVARGTLRYLAQHQGGKVDPSREEEPGKILHEARYGELANLKLIPHTPYYGSVDSTPLFLVAAVEMMDWLNDQDLFVELLPFILGALKWVDLYGDSDHDGFVEYAERASGGVRNQGWKDSHDSLLYPDGRPGELPVALVEVQGYVYQAKVGLSRILDRRQPGARPVGRHHRSRAHRDLARPADGARHVLRLGDPHPLRRLTPLQPDELSQRHDLASRQLDRGRRPASLPPCRGGRPRNRRYHGSRHPYARPSPAGVVLRIPPRQPLQQRSRRVPGVLQPASVGRGRGLPPDAKRARHRARHHRR